jgi:hypothetical protein
LILQKRAAFCQPSRSMRSQHVENTQGPQRSGTTSAVRGKGSGRRGGGGFFNA